MKVAGLWEVKPLGYRSKARSRQDLRKCLDVNRLSEAE